MIEYIKFALDHPHVFILGTYLASLISAVMVTFIIWYEYWEKK